MRAISSRSPKGLVPCHDPKIDFHEDATKIAAHFYIDVEVSSLSDGLQVGKVLRVSWEATSPTIASTVGAFSS